MRAERALHQEQHRQRAEEQAAGARTATGANISTPAAEQRQHRR